MSAPLGVLLQASLVRRQRLVVLRRSAVVLRLVVVQHLEVARHLAAAQSLVVAAVANHSLVVLQCLEQVLPRHHQQHSVQEPRLGLEMQPVGECCA